MFAFTTYAGGNPQIRIHSTDSAKRLEGDKKFVQIPTFPASQGMFVLNSQNGPTAEGSAATPRGRL